VVVRRRTGTERDGRPLLTDVLGHLLAADDRELTVRTRDGRIHTVALADVTAAKRVPARPPTRHEVVRLELAAETTWPAPERELLGDWPLRAAEGFTRRANSALAVGDPGRPLDEAIDAVERWYRARDIRPSINVPLPAGAAVDARLAALGWAVLPVVQVMTVELAELPGAAGPPVTLRPTPSEEFLSLVGTAKEGLPAAAGHVLTAVPEVTFAHSYDLDGSLIGIARGALDRTGEWLGLSLIEVAPAARRRGIAQALLGTLADWGRERGARRAFLQVVAANEPAVRLYDKLGFTTHHTYVTRQR
jgi:ribosomal protein S18 acetylase RimI-like enzyme